MYTSKVACQPSEMSNSLQFDKKGTLGGKILIQGHIEVDLNQGSCLPGFFSLQHATTKHENLSHTCTPAATKITLTVFLLCWYVRETHRVYLLAFIHTASSLSHYRPHV